MRPTLHAFNGPTGAGKSTISKRFAKDHGAFRISHDELLAMAYDQDLLENDHSNCCTNINHLSWKLIEQITSLGLDVVIEGWGSRELRDQVREFAKKTNLGVKFYYVSCSQEERLRRVRNRNKHPSEDAPYISDKDFFRMENIPDEFEQDESFIEISNQEQ